METGKRKNTAVKWIIGILTAAAAAVLIFILSIFAIDPMFHYHAPLKFLSYPLVNERYQNNGIVKHFDYDSIITGTSMTENFKTSEAQKLFSSDFIKVAFSGGGYTEIGDNLKAAYDSGHEIKYVIWGLDYDKMIYGKNYRYTEKGDFPDYLYNDSSLDDIKYFFDPVVVKLAGSVVKSTVTGRAATSFDVYENWSAGYEYGRDEVIKSCELNASASKMQQLTDADRAVVTENLNENVISIVKAHPETTFYFFYPPYSIAHWGMEINNGQLDRTLGAENLITKELLKYDNVRLYSFRGNSELICNLDNYKDAKHYGEWVNSQMLQWMKNDEYRITEENLAEYEKNADDLIKSYDYDQLFK